MPYGKEKKISFCFIAVLHSPGFYFKTSNGSIDDSVLIGFDGKNCGWK
jgi:hypothetical protein